MALLVDRDDALRAELLDRAYENYLDVHELAEESCRLLAEVHALAELVSSIERLLLVSPAVRRSATSTG
jgi:hypothetical protein